MFFVCPLSTITQYYKGYKLDDERNYNHLFSKDIFSIFWLGDYSRYIMFIGGTLGLLIVSYQYFFL